MNDKKILLSINDLNINFGQKNVVNKISFDIFKGEKLALVGESGSGKTITAFSILKLIDDAKINGQILFNKNEEKIDLLKLSEKQLQNLRGSEISMIFQEPMTALNPLMKIGKQITESLEIKQNLSKNQSNKLAIELLNNVGIKEAERRINNYPHQLSGGQRQRVLIAMALAVKPKLLLADEPTTALDVSLRWQILELLENLQKQNQMSILLITHDLPLVKKFADRIIVMENGNLIEQGKTSEIFENPQEIYTKKLLSSSPKRNVLALNLENNKKIIQNKNLNVSYSIASSWFKKQEFKAVKNINLSLSAGETLGIVGESGSGKSSLAQAILGLLPSQGEIKILNQTWQKPSLANSPNNKNLRKNIQVVFQDPFSSLSPRMTVEEIITEGLNVYQNNLTYSQKREKATKMLENVGLTENQFPNLLDRYPHEFSGGQRQRLAIARALIINPKILVLDEPTSALDITIQQQILNLLQNLQREFNLSFLLITHDLQVIQAMAHNILVMKDGKIVEAGSVKQILNYPKDVYTKKLVNNSFLKTNN